ncbi:hypothetical protein FRZ67_18145 [Panacibacter ginsenosidivorans]|uniref:RHS repeat protein n=1 Tax=Panacibacter ginsenosidivorans TaxID=1813871 RepID=A0A5B8VDT3_9BACT|nr:hypothetical protein [Panacibacter ginsenosidivorans]QEC69141.1 hypothetical protein FRZ67_18145 [Panacibacter ginsenosidivorans]
MNSKLFLLLLSFILVKATIGQEISKSDIVRFKVKSITTIDGDGKTKYTEFYNGKGDFIKQTSLNDSKQLQTDRELFYNDSSQLIEERTYTSNGDVNATSKYYYNAKNQLSKREYIQFGEVSATWTFEYDDKGNKISEIQTSGTMGNTLTKYKYDDKGFLVQEDKSNNTIGKEERVNYKYNVNRQIIEKKTKAYYFNTTITLTYSYNETGKLTKLFEKSSNGVSSTTLYEYNDKGLLISDTWESSISKTPHTTTYQIAYE